MQWIKINGTTSDWESYSFNFPISFSKNPIVIISCELQDDKAPNYKVCVLKNLTEKSAVATFNGGGTQNVCVFAIGT